MTLSDNMSLTVESAAFSRQHHRAVVWTDPDGREQQGLLSRPLEAPAASVGVGWTPVAKVFRDSFLGVERTTSLEAQRHRMARGYRHAMTPRLKPWCGLGGQHRVPDRRRKGERRISSSQTLQSETFCPTHACTTSKGGEP